MAYTKDDIKADKARRSPRSDKAQRFNDVKFVQYELDKAQMAELKAMNVTEADVFDQILAAITDGYRFSCKWDKFGKCFAVFMQDSDGDTNNAGFMLTGRGSSPFKAFKQVLYKHTVCLQGEWGSYVERDGAYLIDD